VCAEPTRSIRRWSRYESSWARKRKEVLADHWHIADDGRLSQATTDYARNVAEALEWLTALNLPSIKEEVRSGSLSWLASLARKRASHA
jgi:hypothetical protein